MKVTFTLALLAGLTLGLLGPLGTAEAGAVHSGKGVVLSVDLGAGRLLMTEEPRGTHVLSLNHQTKIVDEMGSPIAPSALRAGDLIREECFASDGGPVVAKQIRLLRPAWMDAASPEQ